MAEFVFADSFRLEPGPTRDFFRMFLQGLVHKQNNYLGAVKGFSDLLKLEDDLTEGVGECVNQIHDSAQVASDLNQRILVSSGCSNVELSKVRLSDILPYLQSKLQEICDRHGVSFQVNVAGEIPDFSADGGKFNEMIYHLVANAAEAAADSQTKAVSVDVFPPGTATDEDTIDFFIRNGSNEVSENDWKRFLLPFETNRAGDHIGIGLTTAAVLAGQMNMRMGLKTEEGTTTVWLAIPAL